MMMCPCVRKRGWMHGARRRGCCCRVAQADLRSGGVPAEVVLFEGEGHAFVKDLQATRAGGAAGRAWGLFRDFLRARAA